MTSCQRDNWLLWSLLISATCCAQAIAAAPAAARLSPAAQQQQLASLQAAVEPQVKRAFPGASAVRVTATPAALRLLPACSEGLVVDLQGQRAYGHLAARVQCAVRAAPTAWASAAVRLPVQVEVDLPMLVARVSIPRGTLLDAGHMELRPMPLGATGLGVGSDFLTDAIMALGQRTRNAIRAGQPLATRHLEAGDLVTAGEQVALAAGGMDFSVSVAAQALQGGRAGEQIRVRNLASGRVVVAWVTGRGRAHTRPPEARGSVRPPAPETIAKE